MMTPPQGPDDGNQGNGNGPAQGPGPGPGPGPARDPVAPAAERERASPASSRFAGEEACSACGGPMVWRQEHPYPVVIQLVFAASFLVFLLFFDRLRGQPALMWSWSALQAGLGVLLIRGRLRTRRRVLHCIRCSAALR